MFGAAGAPAGLDLDGTIVPAVPYTSPQIDELATGVSRKLKGRPFMFLCRAGVTPFITPGTPEAAGIPGFGKASAAGGCSCP